MVGGLHPELEPYEHGMLDVGDGELVYWEQCGNPAGKPALVLHGGPGSGSGSFHRRLFDGAAYRVVLFDQRGSGRSTPNAGAHDTDLTHNTTWNLVADIEQLRAMLGIERWLVLGVSWGATLGFVYAETHPDRVTELVLGAVTAGRRAEIDWMYHTGAPNFFPEQYEHFRAAVPAAERDGDLVEAYARLLNDPDPAVRQRAADEWCSWESTYIGMDPKPALTGRFADPAYRRTFARVVTHYFRHNVWLEEGQIPRDAARLADIPGTMIHGRLDVGGPLVAAWEMKQVWPRAELIVVNEPGHSSNELEVELARATDRYANR